MSQADRRWLVEKYQAELDALTAEKPPARRSNAPSAADGSAPAASQWAPPALELLIGETVDDDTDTGGGLCPNGDCKAPVVDGADFCAACGARVKPEQCAGCKAPLDGGAFCRRCGKARPEAGAPAAAAKPAAAIATVTAIADVEDWDPENLEWFTDAVDMALVAMSMDPMSERERARCLKHAVPMANKYMRAGGRFGVEINFGLTMVAILMPRAYARLVIARERAEDEAERKARAATSPAPAPQPAPRPFTVVDGGTREPDGNAS